MTDTRALKHDVHRRLLASMHDETAAATRPEAGALAPVVRRLLVDAQPLLATDVLDVLVEELLADVVGLGPLERLLADTTVDEIMLNGPGRAFVERHGRLEPATLDLDAAAIETIAQRVVAPLGLRLDRAAPIVDARLADGSRLHAVLPPLAPDGPIVTIRRFSRRRFTAADFGLDPLDATQLAETVRSGASVLVAGATSTGKTSLLNVLAGAVDPSERIVTVEDTAELALPQPHVVRLEARPANSEGAGGCSIRDLVRAALRMRPDRIVVGEVRGAEALDLLLALTTGHRGALCTVHAGSAVGALRRLATLAMLGAQQVPAAVVEELLADAIDVVVVLERDASGARRVCEVHRCGSRP
jgi:pilus assembly protein CpaF